MTPATRHGRASLALLAVVLAPAAAAEDRFGIPVYPGATTDLATEAACKAVAPRGVDAACFRTADAFEKVLRFYAKQPHLRTRGPVHSAGAKGAVLCPAGQAECAATVAKGVAVVLDTPWSARAPGAGEPEQKDVLVRILSRGAPPRPAGEPAAAEAPTGAAAPRAPP